MSRSLPDVPTPSSSLPSSLPGAQTTPSRGITVYRHYHGKVIVIIDDGLQQGFIFEPGQVELEYVADPDSHPRDTRWLKMNIVGSGRMAAALELPGQSPDAVRRDAEQDDQEQRAVRQELPRGPGHEEP